MRFLLWRRAACALSWEARPVFWCPAPRAGHRPRSMAVATLPESTQAFIGSTILLFELSTTAAAVTGSRRCPAGGESHPRRIPIPPAPQPYAGPAVAAVPVPHPAYG